MPEPNKGNAPERGKEDLDEQRRREERETITPTHNRPEDVTPQRPRKTNPGEGFTVDPEINPEEGATKSW